MISLGQKLVRFMSVQLPTVNFHLEKNCNYKCKFCFAHFKEQQDLLTKQQTLDLLKVLKQQGNVQKINFAGGEPLLNQHLGEYIQYAKRLGIATSIVTNSVRLSKPWLETYGPYLDQIAISCDSQYEESNYLMGRGYGEHVRIVTRAFSRINDFNQRHKSKINIKLNTVVNKVNYLEDMSDFVLQNHINRWKVFKMLLIKGENDKIYENLAITQQEFTQFCNRHKSLEQKGVNIVFEDNDLMTQSYIMIDPTGKFYQNTDKSQYIYSDDILAQGVQECLKQVSFDLNKFKLRGGFYTL